MIERSCFLRKFFSISRQRTRETIDFLFSFEVEQTQPIIYVDMEIHINLSQIFLRTRENLVRSSIARDRVHFVRCRSASTFTNSIHVSARSFFLRAEHVSSAFSAVSMAHRINDAARLSIFGTESKPINVVGGIMVLNDHNQGIAPTAN